MSVLDLITVFAVFVAILTLLMLVIALIIVYLADKAGKEFEKEMNRKRLRI